MRVSLRLKRMICCCLLLVLLTACGDKSSGAGGDNSVDGLPTPAQDAGGITGMPSKPGPGAVTLTGEAPPLPDATTPDPSALFNPEAGALTVDATGMTDTTGLPPGNDEPTAEAAMSMIHAYYAALNARQYSRAHALWADGGKASGQTLDQFAAGFSGMASITTQLGQPSTEEPGAGQRHIRIPVSVSTTDIDGNSKNYVGEYVLHRTVVDGASAEQRQWRIATADLREVQQTSP